MLVALWLADAKVYAGSLFSPPDWFIQAPTDIRAMAMYPQGNVIVGGQRGGLWNKCEWGHPSD